MEIRFAGQLIAKEPTEGGSDAVTGFLPKRRTLVQVPNFIRAANALPIARGNRSRTVTGNIIYGAFASLPAALQKLCTNYDDLPDQGALVLIVGGQQTIFGQAVLEEVVSVKRTGVTVAASLTFVVGPATNITTDFLMDQNGEALIDEGGNPLTA